LGGFIARRWHAKGARVQGGLRSDGGAVSGSSWTLSRGGRRSWQVGSTCRWEGEERAIPFQVFR
jgi:hypothetical protein